MTPTATRSQYRATLAALARLHGVQPSYLDAFGRRRRAAPESLARILAALGAPASTEAQAHASLRESITSRLERRLEPVTLAWIGPGARRASAWLRINPRHARGPLRCALTLETGEVRPWTSEAADLPTRARTGPGGQLETHARIDLPRPIPPGYHTLAVHFAGQRLESRVIAAPVRSYRSPDKHRGDWGLFCPVYAITGDDDLGVGDLTNLRDLADWSASLGGRVVATLPLLAANLGEPFDPSPYAPVSRVFWNELFIDPRRAPEFEHCASARRLAQTAPCAGARTSPEGAAGQKTGALVDYRSAGAHKRSILEALSRYFHENGGEKRAHYRGFLLKHPLLAHYSAFRATGETQRTQWDLWPARLRRGDPAALRSGDYDPESRRYHSYAQYLVAQQLDDLGAEVRSRGGRMYLDLPVGVSPYGFDVWRNQPLYALTCATGAPPDPYFTGGQNWGFPPMRPEAMRAEGYETFIAALRGHMSRADYLRLDHVMAFHRLFWIPEEGEPAGGVYVRYEAEELYAVLSLESHRNECRLVGENLGTVPPEVDRALARHDLCGLYVAQYEMRPSASRALRSVPMNCVTSVNTHDMPPLAKHWDGTDIEDRIGLGLLDASKREAELATRARMRTALVKFLEKKGLLRADAPSGAVEVERVRDALLEYLARSPADFVLVNIEDLWLETRWQNIPGTEDEHPNWRRRLRYSLEELRGDAKLEGLLRRFDAMRRGKMPEARRTASVAGVLE